MLVARQPVQRVCAVRFCKSADEQNYAEANFIADEGDPLSATNNQNT